MSNGLGQRIKSNKQRNKTRVRKEHTNKYAEFSKADVIHQCYKKSGKQKFKKKFDTEADAIAFLDAPEAVILNATYKCEYCGYWHVTKRKQKIIGA